MGTPHSNAAANPMQLSDSYDAYGATQYAPSVKMCFSISEVVCTIREACVLVSRAENECIRLFQLLSLLNNFVFLLYLLYTFLGIQRSVFKSE